MARSERPYHHGDLRRSLVETGLDLARRDGIDALGLREITRAVGVSASAAYRHFANRHDLILAIALEAQQRLSRHIVAAMHSELGDSTGHEAVVDRLVAFGLGYIEFAVEERGWYELACYTQHAGDDDVPTLTPGEPAPPPHRLLLDALDDLAAEGVISQSGRAEAEWMLWAAIDGLTELVTTGPLRGRPRPEVERLARRTLDAMISGLREPASET